MIKFLKKMLLKNNQKENHYIIDSKFNSIFIYEIGNLIYKSFNLLDKNSQFEIEIFEYKIDEFLLIYKYKVIDSEFVTKFYIFKEIDSFPTIINNLYITKTEKYILIKNGLLKLHTFFYENNFKKSEKGRGVLI